MPALHIADARPDLRAAFIDGMSRTAAPVTLVTTDGPAGRAGLTVSAMSSVSADTPTLLACVNRRDAACPVIIANGAFCVNVLSADQSHISDAFAGRRAMPLGDKFAAADWTTLTTGAPRVIDPLAAFDCRLIHADLVGTHYVLFGSVVDVFIADDGAPLVYANRAYAHLSRLGADRSAPSP